MDKFVAASSLSRPRIVFVLAGIVFLLLLSSVLLERLYVASSSKALQVSIPADEPLPSLIGSSYIERRPNNAALSAMLIPVIGNTVSTFVFEAIDCPNEEVWKNYKLRGSHSKQDR